MIVAIIVIVLLGWPFLGTCVYAAIDKDDALLEWFSKAPGPWTQMFVLFAWPYFAAKWRRRS